MTFDRTALEAALGHTLSDEQFSAAAAPLGPSVIIAGAGTGKTTVMAARVVWLVGTRQVGPQEVLGLTFTRKATAELAQRIGAALQQAQLFEPSGDDDGPSVSTYDSFAAKVVREFGLRLGIEPDARLIDGASQFQHVLRIILAPSAPISALAAYQSGTIATRVLHLDQQLAANAVSVAQLSDHTEQLLAACEQAPTTSRGLAYKSITELVRVSTERRELLALVEAWRTYKQEHQLAQFSDVLSDALAIAIADPSVGACLRSRYRAVLLDEYQDTSAAQTKLLATLFSGPDRAHGLGHPVSAVGDPLQAIYGWRGAAADNMSRFEAAFPPAADAVPSFGLSINRRSGQQILDVANAVATTTSPGAQQLIAPTGRAPAQVVARRFETWPDEVDWVAEQLSIQQESGYSWSQQAVLVRKSRLIGDIYPVLVDHGIPAEIADLGGLLSLREISTITATLRLLVDVSDNPAVAELLSGPRWLIGPQDLMALRARAKRLSSATPEADPVSLLEACARLHAVPNRERFRLSELAQARITRFAAELAMLRDHVHDPVSELCSRVIDVIGLRSELLARPRWWGESAARQVRRFQQLVIAWEAEANQTSLVDLLSWLQAEENWGKQLEQDTLAAPDAVALLTVHAAKGLEWPVVLLPGLDAGIFPDDRVGSTWVSDAGELPADLRLDAAAIPQLDEVSNDGLTAYDVALRAEAVRAEDRLAYVATSRPGDVLICSCSAWRPSRTRPSVPSRLFETIASLSGYEDTLIPSEQNPLGDARRSFAWPVPPDPGYEDATSQLAASVRNAAQAWASSDPGEGEVALPLEGEAALPLEGEVAAQVSAWRTTAEMLLQERRARRGTSVSLPAALSTSAALYAQRDTASFLAELARPMPREYTSAMDTGTAFHALVEEHFHLGQPTVLDDELIDPSEVTSDANALAELWRTFCGSEFAARVAVALEVPFVMNCAHLTIRGRIDAVFAGSGEFRYQIVDWKTTAQGDADPLQLSVYRLAWAQANGIDPGLVDAVFYYVSQNRIQRPAQLLSAAELEAVLGAL